LATRITGFTQNKTHSSWYEFEYYLRTSNCLNYGSFTKNIYQPNAAPLKWGPDRYLKNSIDKTLPVPILGKLVDVYEMVCTTLEGIKSLVFVLLMNGKLEIWDVQTQKVIYTTTFNTSVFTIGLTMNCISAR